MSGSVICSFWVANKWDYINLVDPLFIGFQLIFWIEYQDLFFVFYPWSDFSTPVDMLCTHTATILGVSKFSPEPNVASGKLTGPLILC